MEPTVFIPADYRRPTNRCISRLLAALATVAALSSAAATETNYWIGTGNGSWNNLTNWSTGRVPNSYTGGERFPVVWTNSPVTITLNETTEILDFTMGTAGRLTGATLHISGNLDWSAGVIAAGSTTISSNATLHGTAPDYLVLENREMAFGRFTRLSSVLRLDSKAGVSPRTTLFTPSWGSSFDALDGAAIELVPPTSATANDILNGCSFRILGGATPFVCQAGFYNQNLVQVWRPSTFSGGFKQDAGTPDRCTLEVGADINTAPSGGLTILNGSLRGSGRIDRASLGGVPTKQALLTGTFDFDNLTLSAGATTRVVLAHSYDEYQYKVRNAVTFGGRLEVVLTNDIEPTLDRHKVFPVIGLIDRCTWSGAFENAPFEGRVQVAGGSGSFLIKVDPFWNAVVLTDYTPNAITARWIADHDGRWGDPVNWDIGQVPNNEGTRRFAVIWDAHPVTITLDQPVTIDRLTMTQPGTLTGNQDLVVQSVLDWRAGTMAGPAKTIVKAERNLPSTLHADVGARITLDQRALDLQTYAELYGVLWLQNGANLHVSADILSGTPYGQAVLLVRAGGEFRLGPTASGMTNSVHNSGELFFTGSSTNVSVFEPAFSNTGTFGVYGRTVAFMTSCDVYGHYFSVYNSDTAPGRVEGPAQVKIYSGDCYGNGAIDSAWINGSLGEHMNAVRIGAGLTFSDLALGPAAEVLYTLPWQGVSDLPEQPIWNTVTHSLTLNGALSVYAERVPNLESSVVFDVIRVAEGTIYSGSFNNVVWGEPFVFTDPGSPNKGRITAFRPASSPGSVALTDLIWERMDPGEACVLVWLNFLRDYFGLSARSKKSGDPPAISLATFRALESLMGQTPEGRQLGDLYWKHTAEVTAMIRTNSALAQTSLDVLRDFLPAVSALLAGKAATAQITQPMVDKLNTAWGAVANYASPDLKAALQAERDRFHGFQDFVNGDSSKWAFLLGIQAPSNAWLRISDVKLINGAIRVEANDLPGLTVSLWSAPAVTSTNWEQVTRALSQSDGYTLQIIDPKPVLSRAFYQLRAKP